jgi:hypothetical protein
MKYFFTVIPSNPGGPRLLARLFEMAIPNPHPDLFKILSSPDEFLLNILKIFCNLSSSIPTPVSQTEIWTIEKSIVYSNVSKF